MVDLARQKHRCPSARARYCTEELKTKPMTDYILDVVQDNTLIIQGIRAAESSARAKMKTQCTYFKYYFEPYGYDKNGKDVYEADILTDKFGSMGVVEWRDSGFVVNFGDTDIFDLSGCFGDSYQMWVVGNIHDNADLIK